MTNHRSDVIAKLAVDWPENATSADILLLLCRAYDAGEAVGFAAGCVTGQQHVSAAMDMTRSALGDRR